MTTRILCAGLALVALLGSPRPSGLQAQSLALPVYTAGQAVQGKQVYEQSCGSCHGPGLDDGEFAPPLRGVDLRLHASAALRAGSFLGAD